MAYTDVRVVGARAGCGPVWLGLAPRDWAGLGKAPLRKVPGSARLRAAWQVPAGPVRAWHGMADGWQAPGFEPPASTRGWVGHRQSWSRHRSAGRDTASQGWSRHHGSPARGE